MKKEKIKIELELTAEQIGYILGGLQREASYWDRVGISKVIYSAYGKIVKAKERATV